MSWEEQEVQGWVRRADFLLRVSKPNQQGSDTPSGLSYLSESVSPLLPLVFSQHPLPGGCRAIYPAAEHQ